MSEHQTHTPGPWTFEAIPEDVLNDPERGTARSDGDRFWIAEQRHAGHVLGVIYRFPEEDAEANARLIAAAPDLLEAAKNAVYLLGTPNWDKRQLDRLRAAIAKAEGR